MGKSEAAAAVNPAAQATREPIRRAPEDAFARAVECAGGEKAMADRSGLLTTYVHEIIWEGALVEADLCPAVERAARLKVSCEDLRPDLIWHRDGAGAVIGYSCPVEESTRGTIETALRGAAADAIRGNSTFAGDFGSIPLLEKSLYAVNPQIPARWLVTEAVCIVNALLEVADDGVETPITSAAAWLMHRNLGCVQALLEAAELRDEVRA